MISGDSDAEIRILIDYSSLKMFWVRKQSVYALTKNAVWSRHYIYSELVWLSKNFSFKRPLVILPYSKVTISCVHLNLRSLLMFIFDVSRKWRLQPSSTTFLFKTWNIYCKHSFVNVSLLFSDDFSKSFKITFWIVNRSTSSWSRSWQSYLHSRIALMTSYKFTSILRSTSLIMVLSAAFRILALIWGLRMISTNS